MQTRFDFGAGDLDRWRALLDPLIAGWQHAPPRSPIGEFVKALISSRTRDAVSLAAYGKLTRLYGSAARLATAPAPAIERAIGEVTHAGRKAGQLAASLATMRAERVDWRLEFLGMWPLAAALGWLERFPGVGRKVAAAVLNASTLDRPVFIVDTHVLRVLHRLGYVSPAADYRMASIAVTADAAHWSGEDFLRFHAAMKRLGQSICGWDMPLCAMCPLRAHCPEARSRGG